MEPEEYEKMYQLEDTHWWFVSKRRLINSFLKKLGPSDKAHILDVGCGTGANLKLFCRNNKAVGIDISSLAMGFASLRGCPYLVRGSINNLPFKNNVFDAVTLLDVLYHRMVTEDKLALDEAYRITKENGKILITDSALEFLRSPHDKAVHGVRRYNKERLKQLVLDAGFKMEKLTYTNFFLFPFVCSVRLWKRLSKSEKISSDLKKVHPLLNHLLLMIQNFERFLLQFINLPIGSSILCIVRK